MDRMVRSRNNDVHAHAGWWLPWSSRARNGQCCTLDDDEHGGVHSIDIAIGAAARGGRLPLVGRGAEAGGGRLFLLQKELSFVRIVLFFFLLRVRHG